MSSPETKRRSPYQGLIPYSEKDAPFFFGREKETRLITANLFASPLTLLYGASGVGKSSVLRAGVSRQLRDREDLLVVVFNSWQSNPVSDLVQAIVDKAKVVDPDGHANVMRQMPPGSEITLGEFLPICASGLNRRLMIILDQFEEYFLYHPLEDEFAVEFAKAVTKPDAPVSFLISIREDFYAKLDRFEGRIPTLYDNYLRIEHLDRKAARIAIEKPIAEYNHLYTSNGQFSIEPELVTAVLIQVETGQVIIGEAGRGVIEASKSNEDGDAQIETPFLQLVMTRLWETELEENSHKLRLRTLERLGGAENIVRTHLDAVISKLTPNDQEIAAGIFHYLVTPSGTKIAYTASDLAGSAELSEAEVLRVLEKLSHGDVRILRPVDPTLDKPGAPRYEIFHDVLAPAILSWRTAYVQAQERADAERREEEQRRRADEQARVASRFRRLAIALAVVMLIALGAVALAVTQTAKAKTNALRADNYAKESERLREEGRQDKEIAQNERMRAESARGIAEKAKTKADTAQHEAEKARLETDKQIKVAEQRKAEADKASLEAGAANEEATKSYMVAVAQARATRIGYSNLLAEQSKVRADEYPQRSLLLALESLNQTQPGDPPVPAAEGALRGALSQTGGRVFLGHNATVTDVAISTNNRWLVSMDEKGVTYIWDVNVTDSVASPHQLQGARKPLVFSNDNRWLVTGSNNKGQKQNDTTAFLWDLNNLESPPRKLSGHNKNVNSVVISSNSRWLITGNSHDADAYVGSTKAGAYVGLEKMTARLWDLTATDPAAKSILLPGEMNLIIGISPDSHWLLTDSRDQTNKDGKTVSLWDLTAANPIAKSFVLRGQTSAITKAVTSHDGHWLATSSSTCNVGTDTNVRLWDLTAADPSAAPVVLSAHKKPVNSLVFSPDNTKLVTGGDRTEMMIDAENPTCATDKNSFLWNLTQPTASPVNIGNVGKPIAFLSSSPNVVLITQPDEITTKVYGIKDGSVTRPLDLRGALVGSSPDYQRVIIIDRDWIEESLQFVNLISGDTVHINPLVLWTLTPGGVSSDVVSRLTGHESGVTATSFSQDKRFLVTGGKDKMVRLWNLTNSSINAAPLRLSKIVKKDLRLGKFVKKDLLDPDARWLATHGHDHTVNVWDLSAVDPTAKPIVLHGHEKDVDHVAVSPDSRWLSTSSADGTVRVWDMSAANPSANPKVLHDSAIFMAFSPDNNWLATMSIAGYGVVIHIWNVSANNPSVNPIIWTSLGSPSGSTYISPDYHWLIDFKRHRVLDMRGRGLDLKSIDLSKARDLTLSPDGDWLVSSESGTAKLWNLRDKNSAATFHDLKGAGVPFVFSPDHRWLFTSNGGKASLWDLKAADPAAEPLILHSDVERGMRLAVFSPDGNWLAVSDSKYDIALLWNLRNLNSEPFVLKGGTDKVISAMDISADNRWLVTSLGTNVKMWDLTAANPADAVVKLRMPFFYDEAVFSRNDPNRQWLILVNSNDETRGEIALWNMQRQELVEQACRAAGRNMSETEWKEYFPDKPYQKTCPDLPDGSK